METIVRKHIARILNYIMSQQLGWGKSNVAAVVLFSSISF